MHRFKVKLNKINDIKDFVKISQMYDFPIRVYRDEKFLCDAKSILGMFSADLSKEADILIEIDNQIVIDLFKKDIEEYTIFYSEGYTIGDRNEQIHN